MKDLFIKDQQRKLIDGQINRRQFMVSVLATGIAASTALSLASEAEAATPKKGGKKQRGKLREIREIQQLGVGSP